MNCARELRVHPLELRVLKYIHERGKIMSTTESDHSTIVGVFEDEAQADKAINELRAAGFSNDQVNMEAHSAKTAGEDIVSEEQQTQTEADEEVTAAELTPGVFRSKPVVTRIVVLVQAPGREQEALAILHRNGANNANIPDTLEPEIAPALGLETDQTAGQPQRVPGTPSTDDFFSRPGEHETPPAP